MVATLEYGEPEGCVDEAGALYGTILHGVMESDQLRHEFLTSVARVRGKTWRRSGSRSPRSERQIDRLADACEAALDVPRLLDIIAEDVSGDPLRDQRRYRAPRASHHHRGLPRLPAARAAHPDRLAATPDLTDVDLVVVRLLGGGRAWEAGLGALVEACGRRGVPLLAFGGEATPDAELVALSSAPSATVVQAFEYLVQGGPRNVAHMLRFLVDTLLMEGFGFEPPLVVPDHGVMSERRRVTGRPTIAVVFYRAHLVAGNTGFVDDLCESLEAAGANALPVYCYSLRPAAAGLPSPVVELLAEHQVAAVITTVLAAGSLHPGEEAWDPGALATLDVPVLQAICATTSSAQWAASSRGLSPVDVAMAVAIPEFDGRVVSVPFSFKEEVDDGDELGVPVSAYRTQPDRTERVARLALGAGPPPFEATSRASDRARLVGLPDSAEPAR